VFSLVGSVVGDGPGSAVPIPWGKRLDLRLSRRSDGLPLASDESRLGTSSPGARPRRHTPVLAAPAAPACTIPRAVAPALPRATTAVRRQIKIATGT
jgi:hypothetical protein